jgi:hypothetical protein
MRCEWKIKVSHTVLPNVCENLQFLKQKFHTMATVTAAMKHYKVRLIAISYSSKMLSNLLLSY